MSIDLKKYNLHDFKLYVSCFLNDEMKKELKGILGGNIDRDTSVPFATKRRIGNEEWVDIALVEYTEEVAEHLHITFYYGLKDVPNPPKSVPSIAKILKIMKMCDKQLNATCEADFIYNSEDKKSSIEFPIVVFSSEKAKYNEIRGLALSRTKPDDKKSDIQIYWREDGSLIHNVRFNYDFRPKDNLERISIERALEVSGQFIA